MKLLLIRHGMTAGNRDKRYIGRTDEPLCEEGIRLLQEQTGDWPLPDNPEVVFISPLIRCRQTAQILFPGIRQIVIDDLAEMDFGIFENRAYKGDLEFSPEYARWLQSQCEDPVPEGESKETFSARCRKGFEEALQWLYQDPDVTSEEPSQGKTAAFVVHGGTIMAIMSGFTGSKKAYYEWNPANGRGYAAEWDGTVIRNITEL